MLRHHKGRSGAQKPPSTLLGEGMLEGFGCATCATNTRYCQLPFKLSLYHLSTESILGISDFFMTLISTLESRLGASV